MNEAITNIILNDFETGKRIIVVLNSIDMARIKKDWKSKDKILADMQEHPVFTGRERWCDLDPKHITLMMMSMLNEAAKLSNEDRTDDSNAVVCSLHFIYGLLVMCLQTRCDSLIEMIRINRLGTNNLTFDYTATFNIFDETLMSGDVPKPPVNFKVVVNNDET